MQEQEMINSTALTTATNIALLPPAERAIIVLDATKIELRLRELVAASADIVEVKDKDGRKQAHRTGMTLRGARVSIEKTGKAARDDANAFNNAVIAKEKELIGITMAEEDRIFSLRDAFDAKLAAEQAERERKEAERVAAIKARIAAIRAIPAGMAGEPSSVIAEELDAFNEFKIADFFAEFKDEAAAAVADTIEALTALQSKALAAEAEAAHIEADRAELARLQAEMAEQKRQAAEQQAAIAAERAALQAERDAMAAEKLAAAEAEAQRIIDSTPKVEYPPLTAERAGLPYESVESDLATSVDQTVVGLPPIEQENRDEVEDEAKAVLAVTTQAPTTPPTLRLGQIAERLGFSLSADFLRTLGFEPSGRAGAAMLFHGNEFWAICAALAEHVEAVGRKEWEPVA